MKRLSCILMLVLSFSYVGDAAILASKVDFVLDQSGKGHIKKVSASRTFGRSRMKHHLIFKLVSNPETELIPKLLVAVSEKTPTSNDNPGKDKKPAPLEKVLETVVLYYSGEDDNGDRTYETEELILDADALGKTFILDVDFLDAGSKKVSPKEVTEVTIGPFPLAPVVLGDNIALKETDPGVFEAVVTIGIAQLQPGSAPVPNSLLILNPNSFQSADGAPIFRESISFDYDDYSYDPEVDVSTIVFRQAFPASALDLDALFPPRDNPANSRRRIEDIEIVFEDPSNVGELIVPDLFEATVGGAPNGVEINADIQASHIRKGKAKKYKSKSDIVFINIYQSNGDKPPAPTDLITATFVPLKEGADKVTLQLKLMEEQPNGVRTYDLDRDFPTQPVDSFFDISYRVSVNYGGITIDGFELQPEILELGEDLQVTEDIKVKELDNTGNYDFRFTLEYERPNDVYDEFFGGITLLTSKGSKGTVEIDGKALEVSFPALSDVKTEWTLSGNNRRGKATASIPLKSTDLQSFLDVEARENPRNGRVLSRLRKMIVNQRMDLAVGDGSEPFNIVLAESNDAFESKLVFPGNHIKSVTVNQTKNGDEPQATTVRVDARLRFADQSTAKATLPEIGDEVIVTFTPTAEGYDPVEVKMEVAEIGENGNVTYRNLPSGDFNVDSFFDIEYRIDFQAANFSIGGATVTPTISQVGEYLRLQGVAIKEMDLEGTYRFQVSFQYDGENEFYEQYFLKPPSFRMTLGEIDFQDPEVNKITLGEVTPDGNAEWTRNPLKNGGMRVSVPIEIVLPDLKAALDEQFYDNPENSKRKRRNVQITVEDEDVATFDAGDFIFSIAPPSGGVIPTAINHSIPFIRDATVIQTKNGDEPQATTIKVDLRVRFADQSARTAGDPNDKLKATFIPTDPNFTPVVGEIFILEAGKNKRTYGILPGSDFQVDSFFDIEYSIEIEGPDFSIAGASVTPSIREDGITLGDKILIREKNNGAFEAEVTLEYLNPEFDALFDESGILEEVVPSTIAVENPTFNSVQTVISNALESDGSVAATIIIGSEGTRVVKLRAAMKSSEEDDGIEFNIVPVDNPDNKRRDRSDIERDFRSPDGEPIVVAELRKGDEVTPIRSSGLVIMKYNHFIPHIRRAKLAIDKGSESFSASAILRNANATLDPDATLPASLDAVFQVEGFDEDGNPISYEVAATLTREGEDPDQPSGFYLVDNNSLGSSEYSVVVEGLVVGVDFSSPAVGLIGVEAIDVQVIEPAREVNLFPVPTGDVLNIESEHAIVKVIIQSAVDPTVPPVEADGAGPIDVSYLMPGVYNIVVHFEDGQTTSKRFLKE